MKIVFATGNMDKMREIHQVLDDIGIEIKSMKEADAYVDVDENGTTFLENATLKAKAVYDKLLSIGEKDIYVLADDSGLEIDALGKEPGIYSARYLGKDTPYSEKNRQILERLKDVKDEDRTARFVCAIAAITPNGDILSSVKTMEGVIAKSIEGKNGFGYDPIFLLPQYGKTSAQLLPEEKNAISHRGQALRDIRTKIKEHMA